AMSCIANDYGFDEVFARQATAVLRRGDLLVLFSTSGNSANLLSAASAAKARGAKVLGILGKGGGKLLPLCDFSIVVGGEDSAMIQEAHQITMHAVCEVADRIAPTDA
ncbi:MAG: SIS domain-containing protein, partial [Planctomycetota bacterium]